MNKNKDTQWDKIILNLAKHFIDEISNLNQRDLINFCLKKNRNVAEEYLKNVKKSNLKNSTLALQKKEEGNEKFKKKQYEESLYLYTESIFYANKNDEVLPLSFSNRSFALERLGYFSESITDINEALEHGYPKEKMQNLIIRKARCLMGLGDGEKAREILKEASKNSEEKDYQKIIENEFKKFKNSKPKVSSDYSGFKLPEPSGGENKNFPFASKHLSVHYDEMRGRHVIANRAIGIGEVLFVEKPFAHLTLTKICCTCCKKTKAPIPCWNCTGAYYCSPKCRDDAWNSFHSFECGFAELFKSVGVAHLSLRVLLKASSSLDDLKNVLNNISEPVYKNGSIIHISKGYEAVHNLVHHSQDYKRSDIFQYTMTALLLALYLKNYTSYFPKESDEEDLHLVCSVILTHILQLICNSFCITHLTNESLGTKMCHTFSTSRVATAVYTSASIMNHSCDPSVSGSFYQNYIIIRAVKNIGKGEEIFNNYGIDARKMKRARRQEILSNQYFFKCKCKECLREFDNYDILTAFKCIKCSGPSITIDENSRNTFCLRCYHKREISLDTAIKHNKFYSLMKEGKLNDDVNLSLNKNLQAWRIGREIFYKFHVDLTEAAYEVAYCLSELEDLRRSILFSKCVVRSVEERFGLLSLETAYELMKIIDIIGAYVIENPTAKDAKEFSLATVTYNEKFQKILKIFPEIELDLQYLRDMYLA